MLMEMLRQYHNHPSLVIWCYMNEILLRDKYDDDMAKKKVSRIGLSTREKAGGDYP